MDLLENRFDPWDLELLVDPGDLPSLGRLGVELPKPLRLILDLAVKGFLAVLSVSSSDILTSESGSFGPFWVVLGFSTCFGV